MQFLDPQKVVRHFDIEDGMRVAELHAAGGYFTPLLKKSAGKYGAVHSFQHSEHHDHAEFSEKVDRVVAINIPSLSNLHAAFTKAFQMLKPKGKLIVIDLKVDDHSEEHTAHLAGLAGFVRQHRFHAGDTHFGIVFKKV